MNKNVVVGFSGGTDSSIAILMLKFQGFKVKALTMQTGYIKDDEIERIKQRAKELDVELIIKDFSKEFEKKVIKYFIETYKNGRTPNPCAMCNRDIKFDILYNYSINKLNADLYATGHYADIDKINDRMVLKEPIDKKKSQIYFLSMINPESLKKTIFPLSKITKVYAKKIGEQYNISSIKESQDICFINDMKIIDYLKKNLNNYFKEGDILDIQGNIIGKHEGILHFTIGQRRGIRYSSDRKLYVIRTNVKDNTVILGEEEYLFSKDIVLENPNFWYDLKENHKYSIKTRYNSSKKEIIIKKITEKYIIGEFIEPERAITPGQIGVIYDNDYLIASGIISENSHKI